VDGSLIESLKAIAKTYDEERSAACV